MNKQEKVRAARARLDAAKKAAAEHAAKRTARDAIGAKAEKVLARLRRTMVLFKATNDAAPEAAATGIAGFRVGYGVGHSERDEKSVRKALEAGTLKVTLPSGLGQGVAPSTAVQRVRFMSPVQAKAIAKYQKALARAEDVVTRREAELAAAIKGAFDTTAKPEPKVLWSAIAQAIAAKANVPYRGALDNDRWEVERDERSIAEAEMHLAAMRSGKSCECSDCQRAAHRAAEEQKEVERIAALPARMVKCGTHGRKRAHVETRNVHTSHVRGFEWPQGLDGRWLDMTVAYCPGKGKEFHEIVFASEVVAAFEKREQARLKAEAKAAAERAKKVRGAKPGSALDIEEGDTIGYICPACGETVVRAEVWQDEEGDLRAGCGFCEMEPLVDGLQIISHEKEAKAA